MGRVNCCCPCRSSHSRPMKTESVCCEWIGKTSVVEEVNVLFH
jgi:hypothetical protein